MRQRLGIARALVNDPAVVFLDEPTLGLDPAGQRQMLDLIWEVHKRGATVLLSTHLLAEVEEVCSRVLILNRGHVVAADTVSEISRRAAAPRSARLSVPPELGARARAALARAPGVERVAPADGRAGLLSVVFASRQGAVTAISNEALRTLVEAGVPLVSFELEPSRLSDAFLEMTDAL